MGGPGAHRCSASCALLRARVALIDSAACDAGVCRRSEHGPFMFDAPMPPANLVRNPYAWNSIANTVRATLIACERAHMTTAEVYRCTLSLPHASASPTPTTKLSGVSLRGGGRGALLSVDGMRRPTQVCVQRHDLRGRKRTGDSSFLVFSSFPELAQLDVFIAGALPRHGALAPATICILFRG